MFTVPLGRTNGLFHQNRSKGSTFNFSPIECRFDCDSLIFIFFIFLDIRSDYHQHLTGWLIYVSCALNFVASKCWENCRTYINSLLNWAHADMSSQTWHGFDKHMYFIEYLFNVYSWSELEHFLILLLGIVLLSRIALLNSYLTVQQRR